MQSTWLRALAGLVADTAPGSEIGPAYAVGAAPGPGMKRGIDAQGSGPGDGTSQGSIRLRTRGWDEPKKQKLRAHVRDEPEASCLRSKASAHAQRREAS